MHAEGKKNARRESRETDRGRGWERNGVVLELERPSEFSLTGRVLLSALSLSLSLSGTESCSRRVRQGRIIYISRENYIFVDYYSFVRRVSSMSCACPVFTNPRARSKVKCEKIRRAKLRISLLRTSEPR